MPDYVVFTILSAAAIAAGASLQKHGVASRVPSLDELPWAARVRAVALAVVRNPIWALGVLLWLPGGAFELQAYSAGDFSVVKPLSRVQLLFVTAIGVGLLGERLTRREWLGVGIVLIGAASLAMGPEPGLRPPPGAPARAALAVGAVGGVGLVLLAQRHWLRHLRPELTLAMTAGVLFATSDLMKKVATEVVERDHGTFAIWHLDTLGQLLRTPDYLASLVLGASSFAVLQMAYAHGRVSFIGPVGGMVEVVIAVVFGALLLGEPLSAARLIGIAVVLLGSWLLVTPEAPDREGSPPSV